MSAFEPPEIVIDNPSDGGVIYWLAKYYACSFIGLLLLPLYLIVGTYVYFFATTDRVPSLDLYAMTAPVSTTVLAHDGTRLSELAEERRELVPLSKIPKTLIGAFLAVEDRRFFEHGALDVRSTARAFFANLRAGQVVQGGSTITQQVAKAFLTPERTLERKMREWALARWLESHRSKEEILALYLNHIFLGSGAYGVQAASRRYFDKDVWALNLGDSAMIAGLAQAPSRLSPIVDEKAALARRNEVLDAMVQGGVITATEANQWKARPLALSPTGDPFRERSPYFAEHVRKEIVKKYGEHTVYRDGLVVETTLLPWVDAAAQESVRLATYKLDKRQGYRGPVANLATERSRALFRERSESRYGDGLVEGQRYLGLVEKVTPTAASVRVGGTVYALPLSNMDWAAPFSKRDSTNDRKITTIVGVLKVGDVVWVKNANRGELGKFEDYSYTEDREVYWIPAHSAKSGPVPPQLSLEQTPRIQAALFSYDHQSGYVTAMAGGRDYDASEFNRIVQACRQPGSAFKPIYYSLALDKGYAYATQLNDIPRAEVDPITGEVWIPKNLNNTVDNLVTLEYALTWSKNIPSVELFSLVSKDVEVWARRLGLSTPMAVDKALALGASCVRMDELTRAFSVYARNGKMIDPVYVRRVLDRHGAVLEDHTVYYDPMLPPEAKLDRFAATAGIRRGAVISPRTAWLTSRLLEEVISRGHSGVFRATKLPAAGKTGTSSATMDVWFVGYTSRWMMASWMGDELRERPLGQKDASYMLTVPMVAKFAYETQGQMPLLPVPWERPPGVSSNDFGGPLAGQKAPPMPVRPQVVSREASDAGAAPNESSGPTN